MFYLYFYEKLAGNAPPFPQALIRRLRNMKGRLPLESPDTNNILTLRIYLLCQIYLKLVLHYYLLGTIHVLRNQDFGFSTPLPFVITFSTERNLKLQFSDPSSPFLRLRKTWMFPYIV